MVQLGQGTNLAGLRVSYIEFFILAHHASIYINCYGLLGDTKLKEDIYKTWIYMHTCDITTHKVKTTAWLFFIIYRFVLRLYLCFSYVVMLDIVHTETY